MLLAFLPLVGGMALTMSPMTAAIMSAVPARRAGAGSAMNDATRELGAALGVAVLGSVAASHYASALDELVSKLPAGSAARPRRRWPARSTAAQLPAAAGHALPVGAEEAFIGGIHLAVTVGAVLAVVAAVIVYRYLPHVARRRDARRSRVDGGRRRARPRRDARRSSPTPADADRTPRRDVGLRAGPVTAPPTVRG